jgi:hypothetical protein
MSEKPESVSLYQFFQRFPDNAAARDYFEHNCWDGSVVDWFQRLVPTSDGCDDLVWVGLPDERSQILIMLLDSACKFANFFTKSARTLRFRVLQMSIFQNPIRMLRVFHGLRDCSPVLGRMVQQSAPVKAHPARRGRGELLYSQSDPRYGSMKQMKPSPENAGRLNCS